MMDKKYNEFYNLYTKYDSSIDNLKKIIDEPVISDNTLYRCFKLTCIDRTECYGHCGCDFFPACIELSKYIYDKMKIKFNIKDIIFETLINENENIIEWMLTLYNINNNELFIEAIKKNNLVIVKWIYNRGNINNDYLDYNILKIINNTELFKWLRSINKINENDLKNKFIQSINDKNLKLISEIYKYLDKDINIEIKNKLYEISRYNNLEIFNFLYPKINMNYNGIMNYYHDDNETIKNKKYLKDIFYNLLQNNNKYNEDTLSSTIDILIEIYNTIKYDLYEDNQNIFKLSLENKKTEFALFLIDIGNININYDNNIAIIYACINKDINLINKICSKTEIIIIIDDHIYEKFLLYKYKYNYNNFMVDHIIKFNGWYLEIFELIKPIINNNKITFINNDPNDKYRRFRRILNGEKLLEKIYESYKIFMFKYVAKDNTYYNKIQERIVSFNKILELYNNKIGRNNKQNKNNDQKRNNKITISLKLKLWSLFFKTDKKGNCQCCKKEITKYSFECGQIISEKNGGSIKIDNFKPICQTCKLSMNTLNMEDFIKKNKYDKIDQINNISDNKIDDICSDSNSESYSDDSYLENNFKKKIKKNINKSDII